MPPPHCTARLCQRAALILSQQPLHEPGGAGSSGVAREAAEGKGWKKINWVLSSGLPHASR